MKNKQEIFSLNSCKIELNANISLDEILERLTSREMECIKAGDTCEWMDYWGCETMCDSVNEYYCPSRASCTDYCESNSCSDYGDVDCFFDCSYYDASLGCIAYDLEECATMT